MSVNGLNFREQLIFIFLFFECTWQRGGEFNCFEKLTLGMLDIVHDVVWAYEQDVDRHDSL